MTFISKTKIIEIIKDGKLIRGAEDPDVANKICDNEDNFSKSGASFELSLGDEVFVTPKKEPKKLRHGETINIGPGHFAVLTTEEYLVMPDNLLGFITVRFTYKKKGLVNISGFHADPGYEGKLLFSVYNAGPVTVSLRCGDKIFSLFLSSIEPPTHYKGAYKIEKIPLDIIESLAGAKVPSLQSLEDEVSRNTMTLKIYGAILTSLVLAVLGYLFKEFFFG